MSVFIAKRSSKVFLKKNGHWTKLIADAEDFRNVGAARELCTRCRIRDAEIVMCLEATNQEVRFPAPPYSSLSKRLVAKATG